MLLTNLHGLPDAFVAAVRNDSYNAGTGDISTTKLIDSPQRRSLARKHRDMIVEDVSERVCVGADIRWRSPTSWRDVETGTASTCWSQ